MRLWTLLDLRDEADERAEQTSCTIDMSADEFDSWLAEQQQNSERVAEQTPRCSTRDPGGQGR